MNTEKIVMALRESSHLLIHKAEFDAAADLIESMQAQLAEMDVAVESLKGCERANAKFIMDLRECLSASRRRERAAEEDLNYLTGGKKCPICKNVEGCATAGTEAAKQFCRRFDWRDPQGAGEGDGRGLRG